MKRTEDVHEQFAECFPEGPLKAYAYLLSKRLEEGHVCIGIDGALRPDEAVPYPFEGIDGIPESDPWISVAGTGRVTPLVRDGGRIYLQRYHTYETSIVRILKEKMALDPTILSDRIRRMESVRDVVEGVSADFPIAGLTQEERIDWQLAAALTALLRDFSIITGGPGTGKTTTLGKLLRILYAMEPGARVALAAPTGKAANRMLESLKSSCAGYPREVRDLVASLKPSTLHRLLGIKKAGMSRYDEGNPLPFDFIIVDEASMIDMPMFARLLSACGKSGRIVLLGDKDQLASVEAGSLLGDLCQVVLKDGSLNRFSSQRVEWLNSFIRDADRRITPSHVQGDPGPLHEGIVELAYSHRVKEAPRIRELSRAVLNNDVPGLEGLMAGDGGGEFVFDTSYDPTLLEQFVTGYAGYIEEKNPLAALKKMNALRVLVTVREGPKGLYAMNRRIEEILAARKLIRAGRIFYENRPVIVTRNNYETGLFNGDVGIVRRVKKDLRVFFEKEEGGLRDIPPAYLSNCETVFAMTIHKSQGSEFENVMVVLPEGTDSPLLTRELLYTGITRAKKTVVVSGSRESVLHACGASVSRISGISDRLRG